MVMRKVMRFSKTTAYKLVAILNVAATGHQDGVANGF